MGDKRTVRVGELPSEVSVVKLHYYTKEVLTQYPDAMVECPDEYEDYSRYITIQVDKTELDLQIEALEEKLNNLPHSYYSNSVPSTVVVINQNTPISEDVLEAIKEDGKNDRYWLHLNGCVLERYLTQAEKDVLASQSEETRKEQLALRKVLEKELRHLINLQEEQDKKYLL